MKRALHIMALVALLVAGDARAQGVADLPGGARVRITLPDSLRQAPFLRRTRTVIGTLVRATPDTLWLHVAGPDTLRVPRIATTVQVSRGASRLRSALEQGLAIGIGVALIHYTSADDTHSRREALPIGGLGVALGAVIGAWSPYESWRTIR
jgi:hypothetical protein